MANIGIIEYIAGLRIRMHFTRIRYPKKTDPEPTFEKILDPDPTLEHNPDPDPI